MATEPESPLEPLKTGRFAGRVAFAQLIRDSLAAAAAQGWSQLILCDAGFEDWPLNERVVIDSLNAWARSGRQFTIVATQYDSIVRLHPRFVNWRRTWGHIVDSRICRQIDPVNFPTVLWSPHWVLQRLDPVRASGVAGAEPERVVQGRELLQELLQVSSPGFPATTLGL
jgi:hypothetical protein